MHRDRSSKIIAAAIVHVFLASNIVFSSSQPDIEKINIPRQAGTIRSKFIGNSDKVVIHIQDAHCNYEAQSNIVRILENLIKNYSLSLISVEGADGFIDTSWFKTFPDDDVRREVAAYFMKKGELTGPEYLSITSGYSIRLFGAETRSYYLENLDAFTSAYPLKAAAEKYHNRIKDALTKLKSRIYNEDLKRLDAKTQGYESKKIQLNEYIRFLQEMAEKHRISLKGYDNFLKMTNLILYEKDINFNAVNKDRSDLIDELSRKMDKKALTELIGQSFSFKAEKISSGEYHNYLKILASQNGIDVSKRFPNLHNYTIYSSGYSRIDNDKLFDDVKKLELALKDKLFENDDQRTLDKLCRHIDILLELVDIKLLNEDLAYYESHKSEFSHEVFASFIKTRCAKYGLAYDLEGPDDAVRKLMPKLEDFYLIAKKRDKALVENTLEAMNKEGASLAVLITGGFHSDGIAKFLESQGISYLIVCPSITKGEPTPYIQILMNQSTSFGDILPGAEEAKKKILAPILISRFISLIDTEIAAYFGRFQGLAAAVLSRVHSVKNAWIELMRLRKIA